MAFTYIKEPNTKWSLMLLNKLHHFQQTGLYCDATIESSDHAQFQIHMCVLAAASSLLHFGVSSNSSYHIKVRLPGKVLKAVIKYLYTGDHGRSYRSVYQGLQCLGVSPLPLWEWSDWLVAKLEQLQLGNQACNINLRSAQKDVIAAHACVLAATSLFIASLISAQKNPKLTLTTNMSSWVLRYMLHYFYTGRMEDFSRYQEQSQNGGSELAEAYQLFFFSEDTEKHTTVANTKSRMKKRSCKNISGEVTATEMVETVGHLFKRSLRSHSCKKTISKQSRKQLECPDINGSNRTADFVTCTQCLKRQHISMCDKHPTKDAPLCDVCIDKDSPKHQLSATPIKRLSLCQYCGKAFQKSYMDSHLRVHLMDKPHTCDTCGKSFAWKTCLNRHTLLHRQSKAHNCTLCSKSFCSGSSLKVHIMTVHEGIRQHVCTICSKAFSQASDLRNHKRVHSGEKPFHCPSCQMQFRLSSTRARHCHTYKGRCALLQESIRTKPPYYCQYCDKVFGKRSMHARHELVHTGRKPFHCQLCDKGFTQKTTLQAHQRTKGHLALTKKAKLGK